MANVNKNLFEERRKQILIAAGKCFFNKGFHGASMKEICDAAELSPGSVYRYFKSKEDIIEAMVEEDRKEHRDIFEQIKKQDNVFESFLRLVDEHFNHNYTDEYLSLNCEVMAESARNAGVRKIVESYNEEIINHLRDIFKIAQSKGEINNGIDIDSFIYILIALADGFSYQTLLKTEIDKESISLMVKEFIRFITKK